MAMTNAQRQQRWLEKNRGAFNLRRRNARKNLGSGGAGWKSSDQGRAEPKALAASPTQNHLSGDRASRIIGSVSASETDAAEEIRQVDSPPAQKLFETKKVGEFRMIVIPESPETVAPESKPLIFRNDYGQVISERQWKMLQGRKERAKEGGYEIDEYSQ